MNRRTDQHERRAVAAPARARHEIRGRLDIDAVRERTPLLAHVPASAKLRKVGPDRWRGRCPIGDHAVGAFSVYRHRAGYLVWNCFACGARGDVFDLIAAVEGVPLRDVIRRLGAGMQPMTDEERLGRRADAWNAGRPALGVLACDSQGCFETVPIGTWADLATATRALGWWVTPDGRMALCPAHVEIGRTTL